jgi:hypothetical protein
VVAGRFAASAYDGGPRSAPPQLADAPGSRPREEPPFARREDEIRSTSRRFLRNRSGDGPAADDPELGARIEADGSAGLRELLGRELSQHVVPVGRTQIAALALRRLCNGDLRDREPCTVLTGDACGLPNRRIAVG